MGTIYQDFIGSNMVMQSMFKCQECGSTQFKLMLQPSFQGAVDIYTNDNKDVIVKVNDKEFVADLMFMNQFAVCSGCEAIKSWQYHYPKEQENPI